MQKIYLFTVLLFAITLTQAQNKVRLAKKIITSSLGTNVVDYTYEPNSYGRIVHVTETQNGKLTAEHYSFTFNYKGLLTSYATKSGIKTWGNSTTIEYDSINRITRFLVTTNNNTRTIKHTTYQYNADTVTITNQLIGRRKTNYIFNADSNIVYKIDTPSTRFLKPNFYSQYDNNINPQLLLGGFVYDDIPISKQNSLVYTVANKYTINNKMEYNQVLVNNHTQGGAKIPTQYKNGLLLKATETCTDADAKYLFSTLKTTTYQYINL